MLDAKIEVMWSRPSGEAGIRFVQLTRNSEKRFLEWLNSRADIAGLARDFKMAKRKSHG